MIRGLSEGTTKLLRCSHYPGVAVRPGGRRVVRVRRLVSSSPAAAGSLRLPVGSPPDGGGRGRGDAGPRHRGDVATVKFRLPGHFDIGERAIRNAHHEQ